MRRLRHFGLGVWEFIAGDDRVTAAGVVLALAATGLVSGSSSAWLVMPLAVAILLTYSIWREARSRKRL